MKLRNLLLSGLIGAGIVLGGAGVRSEPVALDAASAVDETDEPRWVQCAAAGEFKGHGSGAFKFDRAVFDQLIKNFKAHPAYKAKTGVIPFDFHHANEADPSTIGAKGAPAQGWALDLEARDGADGPELWVLAKWIEPARTYIREGRYKWLSVAVWPKARDAKTGAEIGWYMSSIALTNDPFIQGMKPITAGYMHDPYNRPSTPEDVIECLVEIFDLPWSSDRSTVLAELAKLEDAVRGRGAGIPDGRVKEVVASIAMCLNLPVTAGQEEVVRAAEQLVKQAPATNVTAARAAEGSDMKFLLKLAERLGVAGTVLLAAREEDPKGTARLEVETETALERVLAENTKSKTISKTLLEALDVTDESKAAARVADLLKSEKELTELKPEVEKVKKAQEEAEAKSVEEDVAAVVEAHKFPKSASAALRFQRKNDPIAFAKEYPLPEKGMRHITTDITSGKRPEAPALLTGGDRGATGAGIPKELQGYPGRNNTERAIEFVRAKAASSGKKLSWEQAHAQGCELLDQLLQTG